VKSPPMWRVVVCPVAANSSQFIQIVNINPGESVIGTLPGDPRGWPHWLYWVHSTGLVGNLWGRLDNPPGGEGGFTLGKNPEQVPKKRSWGRGFFSPRIDPTVQASQIWEFPWSNFCARNWGSDRREGIPGHTTGLYAALVAALAQSSASQATRCL